MAASEFSHDIDKLKSDIETLRKDVASIARSLKGVGEAKAHETFARAEELRDTVRTRAAATEERIGREIEERPFASVLTAFGVGVLIGKLLDSRH